MFVCQAPLGSENFDAYSFILQLISAAVIGPAVTDKTTTLLYLISATYYLTHQRALNALPLEQYRKTWRSCVNQNNMFLNS